MSIHFSISFVLALVAVICGVLMLLGKSTAKYPLAAIAIICLGIIHLGIFR
jgi:hypothetical protein